MTETFADITDYPGYSVSNLGNIKNTHGKTLKPFDGGTKRHYRKVKLSGPDGQQHNEYVHRLVAGAWCPRKRGQNEVNHIDNNPANNAARNLEWCKRKKNAEHKIVCRFFSFEIGI